MKRPHRRAFVVAILVAASATTHPPSTRAAGGAVEPSQPSFTLEPTFRVAEDRFGNSMAIVGRDRILVGSYQENYTSGAWLFDLDSGDVAQTFLLPGVVAPDWVDDEDAFGRLVAASPHLLAIASRGHVHLYDRRGRWRTTISGLWAYSLAVRSGRVLIGTGDGALLVDRRGRVRRFFPDPSGAGNVGTVALLPRRAILAAPASDGSGNGAVYGLDTRTGAVLWEARPPHQTLGDGFGTALATFGYRVLVGAPWDDQDGVDVGAVYLVDGRTGEVLLRYSDPTGSGGDEFGRAVAGDRQGVLVGAPKADFGEPRAGLAYLLDARTGAWLATLPPARVEEDGGGGRAVALTRSRLVHGGSDWSGRGTVTVYER